MNNFHYWIFYPTPTTSTSLNIDIACVYELCRLVVLDYQTEECCLTLQLRA